MLLDLDPLSDRRLESSEVQMSKLAAKMAEEMAKVETRTQELDAMEKRLNDSEARSVGRPNLRARACWSCTLLDLCLLHSNHGYNTWAQVEG